MDIAKECFSIDTVSLSRSAYVEQPGVLVILIAEVLKPSLSVVQPFKLAEA
jgi:hypothetical protein